jgi:hypothetical protein
MLDQRALLQGKFRIVTQKSDASKRLAAASSRLLELAEKGESSFAAELQRRIAAVGQDVVAVEVNDAETDRTATVDHAPSHAGGFADAKRMRDAIDVALALLDEMFELLPHGTQPAVAQDIADIFHGISEIAALGESATRKAVEK